MTNAKSFLLLPQSFKSEINIYPPSIRQVAENDQFWQCFKLLTLSQEEIEDEIVKHNDDIQIPTPLEFLLVNSYNNKEYEALTKEAFKIFCHTDITLMYELKSILIGKLENSIQKIEDMSQLFFINEENFFDFQNAIRQSIGEKPIELPAVDEDPRIRRIKAKARYRDKIKAKKGMGLQLITCLATICCMNMGLNPLNIGEMSYASIGILMDTYQHKEQYDIDIRSLQAGADSKKIKPKYWISNFND